METYRRSVLAAGDFQQEGYADYVAFARPVDLERGRAGNFMGPMAGGEKTAAPEP